MIVCKLSLILVAISCCISASESANIIDILEWSIAGKEAEVRAEEDGQASQRNCLCDGPSCICCVDFNLTFVDLGGPGCVRIKYQSPEEGFAINVSYGNSLLHSQVVKGPDPEPTCVNLLSRVAQLCARLTELAPTSDGLRGCLQLEPTLLGDSQLEFPLGCFRSSPNGMSIEPSNYTTTDEEESSEPEGEGINAVQILQAVNESAEQGISFFTNLLGLTFGRNNGTDEDSATSTISPSVEPSTSQPQRSSKNMKNGFGINDI